MKRYHHKNVNKLQNYEKSKQKKEKMIDVCKQGVF